MAVLLAFVVSLFSVSDEEPHSIVYATVMKPWTDARAILMCDLIILRFEITGDAIA